MGLSCGIIGLPNVGKSMAFNALARAGASVSDYPFCTIEPNVGVVTVPDERLKGLGAIVGSEDITPTTIKFLDIAGLIKGASKGEGLGNQFLSHVREVEAMVHVVRCFQDGRVSHIEPDINPERDIEMVNLELALADLELVERRLEKVEKLARSGEHVRVLQAKVKEERGLLTKIKSWLGEGKPVRSLSMNAAESHSIKGLGLLTSKPVIYLANVGEDMLCTPGHPYLRKVMEVAAREGAGVMTVPAKLEAEMAELGEEEAEEFRREMGISQVGLTKLIQACYSLLGLITFYTVVEGKVRAWTVVRGTKAPEVAGKVHSDMKTGFIRAEVIPFEDLNEQGSLAVAREKGLVRTEGKNYAVLDGDVIYFHFQI
ncbi:redox-regulated ATPase YchF [bacterium]|nr:redox-regulated ATPase YchF [bacterium]